MDKLSASKTQYNNCFVLGGKSKNEDGKLVKVPMFIDKHGYVEKLWGGKAGPLRGLYALTYEQARRTLNTYLEGGKRVKGMKVCALASTSTTLCMVICMFLLLTLTASMKKATFSRTRKNLLTR